MKINITGEKVKIYRKDKISSKGTPFTTYSIKISQKVYNSDEWISGFVNVKFKKGVEVNNKAEITIKNAFPVLNKWNDKVDIQYMITDFEVTDQGEVKAQGNSDFMSITDNMDDVPFE